LEGVEVSKDYPLYPELKEPGAAEAQALVDRFKEQLKEAAEDVIRQLYCDVAVYIESDSWTNFRNEIMAGFKNYNNRKIQGEYNFAEIRKQIYNEFKEELLPELNQDLVKENEDLKAQLKAERESRRFY
jgi:5,10-methylenetetrahydrofolate reductase